MNWASDSVDFPNAPEACPFCGGTSGFYHKYADVSYTFYSWDGVAIDTNNDVALFSRKLKCSDCEKTVEKFIVTEEELL